MDVNSDTFAAPQFAASGCNFGTCPARGLRDNREFRSKFLRTAVFGTAIDSAMEPSLPKPPGQFCAHEGNAHGPRHLRDLRAHTRVFPHHLRAHKTTTSCAQPPSSCAQRFVQTSLARCTVRGKVERSGVEGSQVEPSNGPHSAPLISRNPRDSTPLRHADRSRATRPNELQFPVILHLLIRRTSYGHGGQLESATFSSE
jgi:hypothetical protein